MKWGIRDDVYHITYTLEQEQTGEFIRIPFRVPENVQKLEVLYQVEGKGRQAIDVSIEDTKGYRGWSNHAKNRCVLSDDYASEGYLAGPLLSGKWTIIIGAVHITKSCEASFRICTTYKHNKWYKGDLHTHTLHSDGMFSLDEMKRFVQQESLDFIATTDHNTFSQNTASATENLVIIPGVELSTYQGHMNFIGHHHPISHFICERKEDIMKYVEEGKAKESIISLNHPFHKDVWKWGLNDFDFTHVEVWNAWYSEENQKAIDWWHNCLCRGKRLIAVGGSDFHKIQPRKWYGCPTTWVEADAFSKASILEGIKAGRACITANPSAPRVEPYIGEQGIGEVYQVNDLDTIMLKMTIHKTRVGILFIIGSQGIVKEVPIDVLTNQLTLELPSQSSFYRIEIRDVESKALLCLSNPIYME